MLNQSLSIDKVEAQFIEWRRNKSRSDIKIPPELWSQVKILLKSRQYSTGIITRRLRLTNKQLREHKLLSPVITNKTTNNSFVSLSIPPNSIKSIDQTQIAEISILQGDLKCIIANPTTEHFQLIISKIFG